MDLIDVDMKSEQEGDQTSFEGAFNHLRDTVTALEAGGLTLDETTQLYESGMKLVMLCNKLLNEAELRIQELRQTFQQGEQPTPSGSQADDDESHSYSLMP